MKKVFRYLPIFFSLFLMAFSVGSDNNFDIQFEKSITELSENNYLVNIKINNGNQVNGIAKYETKLPLSADFIKEIATDQSVSMKLDGRKIKFVWLHIQKKRSYQMSFQIQSKRSIEELKMDGTMFANFNGEVIQVQDTISLKQF